MTVGDVVGSAEFPDPDNAPDYIARHAVLYYDGSEIDLGVGPNKDFNKTAGGEGSSRRDSLDISEAYAISDSGYIVGGSYDYRDSGTQIPTPVVFSEGEDPSALGGTFTIPVGDDEHIYADLEGCNAESVKCRWEYPSFDDIVPSCYFVIFSHRWLANINFSGFRR